MNKFVTSKKIEAKNTIVGVTTRLKVVVLALDSL